MARLRFDRPVNFVFHGYVFNSYGQSNVEFRLPNSLVDEFMEEYVNHSMGRLPSVTFLDTAPGGATEVADTDQRLTALENAGGAGHPNLATHDAMGLVTEDDLDAHELAPDPHTVYALDADLTAHAGAADPHTGYQRESEKGVAGGYASLDGGGTVPDAQIPASIARDSELPDLAGHVAAGDPHPAYALDSDLAAHEGASDPHTGYVREADANWVDLTDGGPTTLHSHAGGGGGEFVASSTIWDAKGDLAVGTGADTAAALTVGANDQILMADSAEVTGLKWVSPATPSTQAFGDSAAAGTADTWTRGDHKHAMPADPVPAHEAAADPHAGYQKESEKGAASGYASLDGSTLVPVAQIATGTPDGTKFLRDDRTWQSVSAGSHPDLATHDSLGLATDAELATHAALQHGLPMYVIAANDSSASDKAAADIVCDATADEVQIAGAVTALSSGGVIFFAPGTYNLAAVTTFTANKRWELIGPGAIFNVAAGVTGFKVNQTSGSGIRGVHLRGLRIIGAGKTDAGSVGIELEDTNNSTIIGCYISDIETAILIESNTASSFVEGTLIDDVLVRTCTAGVKMVTVSGTGSFAQTTMRHLKIAGTTTGFDLQSGGILQRSHIQGTCWIDTNEMGWRFDANVEDSQLHLAVEGAGGATGNTGLYVGTNAANTDQAFFFVYFTGTIATQVDNTGNKDFTLDIGRHVRSFSTGTAKWGLRRHGDSTDRMRLTMPTAGGVIELGDGSALDVKLYRSAADVLKLDDKFDPNSLNLQVKAGTPVDGDVTGGAADGDVIWDSTGNYLYVRDGGSWVKAAAQDIADHNAAGDPHAGYRLESADHTHASSGLQGGQVAHSALSGIGADDHHARSHNHNNSSDGASLNPSGTFGLGGTVDTITTTGAITAQAVTNAVLRWNGAGSATLHGVAGGAEGRVILVENVTTGQNLTLAHQSATETTATNRIIVPDAGDFAMRPGTSMLLAYDNTTQRWRVFMPAGSASTPTTTDATAASAGTAGSNFSRSDHRHLGHNQSHAITSGSDHSHSGGTAGRFFRETGATSFAFEAIPFSRGGTIYKSDGIANAALNVIVWRAPFACTVTAVKGYRVGGTGATINARRNGTSNHLASDLSLSSADTWTDGGSVQNTAYAAGDKLEIMVVSTTGTVTQLGIQVDYTRP